jgi:acyl-CoA synthetase (AMP-forming)/AMP-acid ligase II
MKNETGAQPDWQFYANFNPKTLDEILRRRAYRQPDYPLYTFLTDDDTCARLTYAQLDTRARAIAALLQQYGAAGQRVLLLFPPGLAYLEAFFGCLYAGAIAVPAYPPKINRQSARLLSIAADSGATIALTNGTIFKRLPLEVFEHVRLQTLRWQVTDDVPDGLAEQWREPEAGGDSIAFLQYTSGSTAAPKGVMVTHANLIHNERMMRLGFKLTDDGTIISWLPLYHDMGIIGMALQGVYSGVRCVMMPPASFLQRPYRWLRAITEWGGTFTGAPNFAYDLCVRKVTPAQFETLDLSTVITAYNGAEPIRTGTLRSFAERFAPCGFRHKAFFPGYGLAEGTLFVSCDMSGLDGDGHKAYTFESAALEQNRAVEASGADGNVTTLVSCGRPLLGQEVFIVNPETRERLGPDEIGEIWVSGESVTLGYWEKPELTEQTFRAFVAGTGEGPFLRTGDLGFIHRGDLFIAGRLKDLLIFGGRNFYPQDIELTVESCSEFIVASACAAFSIEVEREDKLVVMAEVNRHLRPWRKKAAGDEAGSADEHAANGSAAAPDLKELVKTIRQAISEEHDLQVYAVALIKTGSIARTSSGKIQRHACRANYLNGTHVSVI